jgi:hypothetical protein
MQCGIPRQGQGNGYWLLNARRVIMSENQMQEVLFLVETIEQEVVVLGVMNDMNGMEIVVNLLWEYFMVQELLQ